MNQLKFDVSFSLSTFGSRFGQEARGPLRLGLERRPRRGRPPIRLWGLDGARVAGRAGPRLRSVRGREPRLDACSAFSSHLTVP